ncbi:MULTISPECIES: RepA leader peptide Tap [Klebsiella]|nr:RepA leader peptide Tap [Klebsiella michiganensis]MDM4471450.1 RepA leader peptide Tap [Klebsiella michiganensis]HAT3915700.1 RepA leader peptide Tap [Klebsiella oxytoca]
MLRKVQYLILCHSLLPCIVSAGMDV